MQAVILAAGSSTRTYPLTSTRPKPLIPIWDRPFLAHQLAQLDGLVDEAILVVGYKREQIEDAFGDVYGGVRLRYVEQREQRGTADAVLTARPFVTDRVLILNGDDFYHRDDLRALAERGRGLLVMRAPDPQNRAVVTISDGVISDIVEKPSDPEPGAWCSVGGYAVEAADLVLLDDLPLSPRGELELPDFVLRVVANASVAPQKIARWWLPLTYAWDVLTTVDVLFSTAQRADDLKLATSSHASATGPLWLGNEVRIGEGARIVGPTSLGHGTTVSPGAVLERVATFEGAQIGAGAVVRDSVIGAGARVGARSVLDSAPGSRLTIDVKGKPVVPELSRLGSILGDGAVLADDTTLPAGSLVPAGESA